MAQGDEAEAASGALQPMQQRMALRVVLRCLDGGPSVGEAVDKTQLQTKKSLLGSRRQRVNQRGAHVHVPNR